jgi:steroid delta-isomerase-like uncharacterized protein
MAINVQEKKTYVSNSAAVKEGIAAYTKGDFDGAIAPYADDAEVSDPTGKYKGKPQILTQLQVWHTAFPDAKAEITNQLTEGDQVLTEVTFRGTHTGPLAGAMGTTPPTGKRVELNMAIVSWFRGGRVQRERDYFDLAGLMQQLGIAPTKS